MRIKIRGEISKMILSNKHLLVTAVALTLSAPAFAGASLDSLLGGGVILSGNGSLSFSDFQFTPTTNAPSAADIDVTALNDGLLFGNSVFTNSTTGIVDFNVSYSVTGIDVQIQGVESQSLGSGSNGGSVNIETIVLDAASNELANLTNTFSDNATVADDDVVFAPEAEISISNTFLISFENGSADVSQNLQSFETIETAEEEQEEESQSESSPTAVPSPTAAIAGVLLLGAMGIRRRRNA